MVDFRDHFRGSDWAEVLDAFGQTHFSRRKFHGMECDLVADGGGAIERGLEREGVGWGGDDGYGDATGGE